MRGRLLALLLVLALLGGVGRRPLRLSLPVGHRLDGAYLEPATFHDRETTPDGRLTFRWSRAVGRAHLEGVGRGPRTLTLILAAYRPDGAPVTGEVRVNGRPLYRGGLDGAVRRYRFVLPQGPGDLLVEVAAPTFRPQGDPRELGVLWAGIEAARGPGSPLTGTLLWIGLGLLALAGIEVLLRWPLPGTLVFAGGLGWVLLRAFLPALTLGYALRWGAVPWIALGLLALVRRWVPDLYARGGVDLPAGAGRGLFAVFVLGLLPKLWGLAHPFSRPIDLGWHLERADWILRGRFLFMYTPTAFHQSVMPVQWGEVKPIIPYSSFYHVAASGFRAFPWSPFLSANVLAAAVDLGHGFLIYYLVRRLGGSARAGVLGALAYATLPVTFLLHSWGNRPTTFGLWWLTLGLTLLTVPEPHRTRRWRVALGLTLALAFLSYTVVAAFLTVFLGFYALGRLGSREGRRELPALLTLFALAALWTFAIYFEQYVTPFVRVTIPHIVRTLRSGGPGLGMDPIPFSTYLSMHLPRLFMYGLWTLLPLTLAGLGRRALTPWEGAWVGTALLFFLAGWRVDMVDKHFFFLLPWLAVRAGLFLDWARGWGAGLAWGLLAYNAVDALYLFAVRMAELGPPYSLIGRLWGTGP